MDGIINIYKETGFTSHDAVAKLRGIVRQRKIGHTGTLDPMAEGVLPVCLGNATKACEYLTDHEKEYTAVMRLGVTTDSQDATGTVFRTTDPGCTEEQRRACVKEFEGEQLQLPSIFSAVWVDGKRLYDLARKGKTVEREKRRIMIHEIEVQSICFPLVTLRIVCSKGTYIRTLCNDIGERLGCGAMMESLLRTRVGTFTLEEAKTLQQIEQARDENRLSDLLLPTDRIFLSLPSIQVREEDDRLVKNGNPVPARYLKESRNESPAACGPHDGIVPLDPDGCVRVYLSDGSFTAVYRMNRKRGMLMPEKMFISEG